MNYKQIFYFLMNNDLYIKENKDEFLPTLNSFHTTYEVRDCKTDEIRHHPKVRDYFDYRVAIKDAQARLQR